MKRIVRCVACDELTKYYGSYKVKVRDFSTNPLTGELKEIEYEGQICPKCNTRIYPKERGGEQDANAKIN